MPSDDVQCPYCEKYFDVDTCEQEPDNWFEEYCPHCGKGVFVQVEYYPSFSIEKAPCLNGGEHEWYNVTSSFHGKYSQCNCGKTKDKISDKEAWEIQEKWMKEIKDKEIKKVGELK